MKKNLYIANLLVAGLMTFTGCTDGFESDNANKAGYTPELQEYDLQKYVLNLGVMQQGIYFNYDWGKGTDWTFQTIQNLGHDMFAGYFHDMNNSFNDKNSVYALNDGWTGFATPTQSSSCRLPPLPVPPYDVEVPCRTEWNATDALHSPGSWAGRAFRYSQSGFPLPRQCKGL